MCAYDNRNRQGGYQNRYSAPPAQTFFDPKKELKELVDELAEKQADSFPSDNKNKLNSTQLRKFFGEVKNLYNQYEARRKTANKDEVFKGLEPHIKVIRSKAYYAKGRKTINDAFFEFLQNGISKVTNAESFEKFVLHFEAVVGFMYGKGSV